VTADRAHQRTGIHALRQQGHAYTAGYERKLPRVMSWLGQGIGAQLTSFVSPPVLEPVYGAHPWGIQAFVRLRLSSKF
jgi:hypothetical protein